MDAYTVPESHYIDIREPGSNWLLFKFDPLRGLIEIKRRGVMTVIDLAGEIARQSAESAKEAK